MKDFFKDKVNLSIVVLYGIGSLSVLFVMLSAIFYFVFAACFAAASIMVTIKVAKSSKKQKQEKGSNLLNASLFDYDEEVYVIDEKKEVKRRKNLFSDKKSLLFLFVFMSVIFAFMFISGFFLFI